jgi:hypothetical protein
MAAVSLYLRVTSSRPTARVEDVRTRIDRAPVQAAA